MRARLADKFDKRLPGYGLTAGEVAEQTQKGLSCSLTSSLRGFLPFASYFGTVANGPTGADSNHVSKELEIGLGAGAAMGSQMGDRLVVDVVIAQAQQHQGSALA
ncbi:hypothetical protein CRENBAI_004548 [Crenichthys baileyi]|uniref:Uncharacterized protein n=1 Tax=Crenichthys baileyi TaxID=28760 RepID=A0AAV9SM19_9TELE